MKVWFLKEYENSPQILLRSKPSQWYFDRYEVIQEDINEFEDTLKFARYNLIATGLETSWQSQSTGIIYKMSTEESMKALSRSIAGVLSGRFNVKQHGGYCTLYYVTGE